MTEIPNHPVYSKNVLEMLTVANDYCLTMAKVENKNKSSLIDYLQKICPLLYIKGSLLPDIEVQNSEANEKFMTEEEWERLFNELRKKFAKDDEFWFMDNSDISNNEPVNGSLSECFTDIYQDLKDFLDLYQKNSLDAKENAVYELKRAFEPGWGLHIVNAHKALHYIILGRMPQEDKFDIPGLF